MIDILNKIIFGEISKQDAEQVFDDIMDRFHSGLLKNDPQDEMCLNNHEWTAVAYGVDLDVLANWRKNGWPRTCINCNRSIDYKNYGWRIEQNGLKCFKCNK